MICSIQRSNIYLCLSVRMSIGVLQSFVSPIKRVNLLKNTLNGAKVASLRMSLKVSRMDKHQDSLAQEDQLLQATAKMPLEAINHNLQEPQQQ